MTVDLRFICDEDISGLATILQDSEDNIGTCSYAFNYAGKMGCGFDLSGLIAYIARYIGWIMIIGGLLMTFYGANFIIQVLTFIVFLGATFTVFFFAVNAHLVSDPRLNEDEVPVGMIIVVLVSLIIGSLVAYGAKKFIEQYSTMLLGAFGLGMVIFFVVDKIDVPQYVKFLVTAFGAGLGGYFCSKSDRYVKAGLTALIGSCLLMQGISFYIDTPDASELQKSF